MPHGEHEPFCGSGTTLPAAELTERVCCAIDLDPKYVDVTVQRWETLPGKKAKLEADGRTFEEVAEERRRRPHEFQAAARRSRRRKRSFAPATRTSRGFAGLLPTGRGNSGYCNKANVRPPLRQTWPTFAQVGGG